MEIVVREEGSSAIAVPAGRLDAGTSQEFESFIQGLYDQGVCDVVVDMGQCPYVSSAGLRAIVAVQKRAMQEGSLSFRNVPPSVMEVFDITGFSAILSFE